MKTIFVSYLTNTNAYCLLDVEQCKMIVNHNVIFDKLLIPKKTMFKVFSWLFTFHEVSVGIFHSTSIVEPTFTRSIHFKIAVLTNILFFKEPKMIKSKNDEDAFSPSFLPIQSQITNIKHVFVLKTNLLAI